MQLSSTLILLVAAAAEAQVFWRANGIAAVGAGLAVHAPVAHAAVVDYHFLEARKNKTGKATKSAKAAKASKTSGVVAIAATSSGAATTTDTGASTPCTTNAAGEEDGDCQDSTNGGADASGAAAAVAARNTGTPVVRQAAACTTNAAGDEEGDCQDSTNGGADASGSAAAVGARSTPVFVRQATNTTADSGTDAGDNAPCTTSAAGEEEGNC